MKKQLFYASALMLGLSLASCSNEDESLNFQDNSFTVEASLKKQSRTLLEADSKAVVWSNGDQIYLFGGDSYSTMTLSAGAGEDEGTFNGLIYGSMDELQKALYPVPNVDGESYTYDFPAEKEWSENSQSPMIGDLEEGSIAFKNLVAMIRIDLDGCEYDNNSILTLELVGQPISGTATVDVDKEVLTIGQGGNTVKVTKFGDARFVDIPVPAGEYTSFKVTIDNTTIIDKQSANTMTLGKDDVLIDGKVATEEDVEVDTEDGSILIKTVADLSWFEKEVNKGNTFKGKTVKLANDINLANKQWTPIGSNGKFSGTFDGCEHKISNLNVSTEGRASAGLFANAQSSLIKNLTLENVNISGHYKTGAIVGDGLCAKVENCHVIGGTITSTPYNNDDANNVGGIVGYLSAETNAWVKNCTVDDLTIKAYRKVGGIVGAANGANAEVLNNKVSNTTIIADQTDEYKEVKVPDAGEIVGANLKGIDLSSNTATNVSIEFYVKDAQALASALTGNGKNIAVVLSKDIDLPITSLGSQTAGSGEYKLGSESTQNIIIDLNSQKLNITTTYWSAIGAKNDNATITIKNGSMTSTGNSAGTWNAYDVRLCNCNYVIENVTFDKPVALDNVSKSTKMNTVTINDNGDRYALWITAEGQTVEIDGLTVKTSGRGIKIDEEYVNTTKAKVTLKVSNANFTTAKKAAIMVKSAEGADITLSNVDINNVAADKVNEVWVDADAKDYYDLVTVKGGTKAQEE